MTRLKPRPDHVCAACLKTVAITPDGVYCWKCDPARTPDPDMTDDLPPLDTIPSTPPAVPTEETSQDPPAENEVLSAPPEPDTMDAVAEEPDREDTVADEPAATIEFGSKDEELSYLKQWLADHGPLSRSQVIRDCQLPANRTKSLLSRTHGFAKDGRDKWYYKEPSTKPQ